MFRLSLFFSFFICYFLVSAQLNYDIRYFGEESGFYDTDEISDVQVDSEGNVWIVTFSEIYKFNGHKFKKIETDHIDHSIFLRFRLSKKNDKTILDFSGRVFFIENDELIPFEKNEYLLEGNSRNFLIDFEINDKSNFSISFLGGAHSYIKVVNNELTYPLYNEISSYRGYLLDTTQTPFWSYYYDSTFNQLPIELSFIDENVNILSRYNISVFFNKKRIAYPISSIQLEDGQNLASIPYGYLLKYSNKDDLEFVKTDFNTEIFRDNENNIWISRLGKKPVIIESGLGFNYDKAIEFGTEGLRVTTQDCQGNIWMFSKNDGLMCLVKRKYERIYIENELSKLDNYFIGIKGDTILACSDDGQMLFYKLEKGSYWKMTNSNFSEEKIHDYYFDEVNSRHLFPQRKKIAFIDDQGLGYIDIEKRLNSSRKILKSPGGRIKFGKMVGKPNYLPLFQSLNYFELIDTNVSYVSKEFDHFITDAIRVSDTVWVSTEDGLYRKDKSDTVFSRINKWEERNKVNNLAYFNNSLWFTLKGGGVFYLKDDKRYEFKLNNEPLRKARIYERNQDELWLISSTASIKLEKNNSNYLVAAYNPIPWFAINDSYVTNEAIYLATVSKGLLKFDFKEIERDTISDVRFYFSDLKIKERYEDAISTDIYSLEHDQGFVQITYAGVSYLDDPVYFRYRMLGISEDWTKTEERLVQFTTLPPGDYQFELQAKTGDKPWSSSKIIRFHIDKPFWQEIWFFILLLLGSGGLIYLFVMNRLKTNKKEQELVIANLKAEQRALRAQMNPHFIFNVISSAQYFILKKDTDKANQFLNMFSRLLRSSLKQSGMNMISIEQEVLFIEKYLELERFRLEGKFEFNIDTSQMRDFMDQLIPQFMLQPFVENAIQHGIKDKESGGVINIIIASEGMFFKISIEDNGPGINYTKELKKKFESDRESFGISITEERLKLYNENEKPLEIKDISTKNKTGTKVILYLKRKTI